MTELPSAIERLQAETKDQRRALIALQTELVRYRAEELAAEAVPTARGRLVLRAVEADANSLKATGVGRGVSAGVHRGAGFAGPSRT